MSVTNLAAEFHPPSLSDFFPPAVLFEGTPFELDRLMLIRILMSALLIVFMLIALRSPKIVPRGIQNVAEIALDFVRIHVAEDVLGKEQGRRFLPVIMTIFFTVLAVNASAVIPFLNISSNARIGLPIVLAAVAYVAFVYAGVKKFGVGKFVKGTIVIPGIPPAMHVLLIPLEFISNFVLRPFTLTVRLLANMLAGHIMLVLFFSATQFFLFEASAGLKIFAAPSLIMGFLFTMFEMLVIFLQAYIFALLTAIYIDLSLHADSH
ncbi:ATP synthase F0 subunit A [Rhodococcus sp. 15-649-2-2]|nr:ATP synthase F0 subunit A [Rhodococcus sp. 15-649-2-2]